MKIMRGLFSDVINTARMSERALRKEPKSCRIQPVFAVVVTAAWTVYHCRKGLC